MASTGLKIAGAGANDAAAGDVAWTNPGNITASDDTPATATLDNDFESADTTQLLKATTFDFSVIPVGATIDGFEFRVEAKMGSTILNQDVTDITVQAVRAGTIEGTDISVGHPELTGTDTLYDFGSPTELLALTWTRAQAQNSTTGWVIQYEAFGLSTSRQARVDAMWMNCYYTEAVGGVLVTPAPAILTLSALAPTVVMGNVALSPTAAILLAQALAPSVVLGSLIVAPAPAIVTLSAIAPMIPEGGVLVTPAEATVLLQALGPTVVLGSVTVGPPGATVTLVAINPVVLAGAQAQRVVQSLGLKLGVWLCRIQ